MASTLPMFPAPTICPVITDEAAAQTHVMRPAHVVHMRASRGRDEGTPYPTVTFPHSAGYTFDVDSFVQALSGALKDQVAGCAMELRQEGTPLATLHWGWAQTPSDGGVAWTPDVRMHIASCSKLLTAIAMTT